MAVTPQPSSRRTPTDLGAKVLIIEDDEHWRKALRSTLTDERFHVRCAETGDEGLDLVASWHPDVVVLDLRLPDMDGLEVCEQIHAQWPNVQIIVLSVDGKGQDKAASLRAGAYDHVAKPYYPDELILRIRVGLRHMARRTGASDSESFFRTGELAIDFERRRVTVGDREVHLAPKEYDVLKYLAQNVGLVTTYETLLWNVWGPGYEKAIAGLRVTVANIRQKVEPDPGRPRYLRTITSVGYRLVQV